MPFAGMRCATCGEAIAAESTRSACSSCSSAWHAGCAPAGGCGACGAALRSASDAAAFTRSLADARRKSAIQVAKGFGTVAVGLIAGAAVAVAIGRGARFPIKLLVGTALGVVVLAWQGVRKVVRTRAMRKRLNEDPERWLGDVLDG